MLNPLQRISLLFAAAFRSLGRPRCWLPLLAFWALQAALLLIVAALASGSGGTLGWIRAAFGEDALEYPRFYLLLPEIHRRLYLGLAATVGLLFQAVSLLRLAEYHSHGRVLRDRPWRRAALRWPGLFVINLGTLALFLLPRLASNQWVRPALGGGAGGAAADLGLYAIGFLWECLLLYAMFLYAAFRAGIWGAVTASARFAWERFAVTLGIVLIPFLLALPLQSLLHLKRAMAMNFRPELVLYSILFVSLLTMLLLYLQLSALVRHYVDEVIRNPEKPY